MDGGRSVAAIAGAVTGAGRQGLPVSFYRALSGGIAAMQHASQVVRARFGRLAAARPAWMARARLYFLLLLLLPLFAGLQYLVQEGVPRVEIRFVSEDVPVVVPVERVVDRVVERVVYVPEAPESDEDAAATEPMIEVTATPGSTATPGASARPSSSPAASQPGGVASSPTVSGPMGASGAPGLAATGAGQNQTMTPAPGAPEPPTPSATMTPQDAAALPELNAPGPTPAIKSGSTAADRARVDARPRPPAPQGVKER